MKKILLYIIFISILIVGVSAFHIRATENTLRVIDSRTTVNRGDVGYITIMGKPETKYVIETTYKANKRVINVTQAINSGKDGKVTFKWRVSLQTESGTRSALISGGGEMITLTHTVP